MESKLRCISNRWSFLHGVHLQQQTFDERSHCGFIMRQNYARQLLPSHAVGDSNDRTCYRSRGRSARTQRSHIIHWRRFSAKNYYMHCIQKNLYLKHTFNPANLPSVVF